MEIDISKIQFSFSFFFYPLIETGVTASHHGGRHSVELNLPKHNSFFFLNILVLSYVDHPTVGE